MTVLPPEKPQPPRCAACDGERVLWLMSEFPVPCPDCNPNSLEYRAKHAALNQTNRETT
jgi:hypothetical protein